MGTEVLTGWGRTAPTTAEVVRPADAGSAAAMLASPGSRGVIGRGLGRSYGDAAQNAGGMVVATAALDHITWSDEAAGLLAVGGGTSLDAILRALVPRGWFVPVSPGTRWVSVGGAIAADVHGKNHHAEGSFASHVTSLTLATPAGTREVTPSDDPDLFWATAGGMGLTGIILGATLRMLPIETSRVRVVTERAADLDDVMARMSSGDAGHRYSVAWIDCLAQGRALGRSVLTRGDHARVDELPAAARQHPLRFDPSSHLSVPAFVPGLVNRTTVRLFNEGWFRKAKSHATTIEPISGFFHPLDAVRGWNRLYGPGGFVQYQFVVPLAAVDIVQTTLQRLSALRLPSFLAVLKRFGPADPGPLSFPMPGWTLALDLPARLGGLAAFLDTLDELVAGAGGRVYLAKDGRLRPDLLAHMYPRLGEWKAVRDRVDPQGVLQSDLARRLGLTLQRRAA
ncbi:MAG: linked oxidase domain protein [Actinobacteria bacterium]|jgi:decaprenylphospho-beta-D-ribofuranose 2-oxidase|nr:linked oxidase domain protein [Actinomycetota bacterium]